MGLLTRVIIRVAIRLIPGNIETPITMLTNSHDPPSMHILGRPEGSILQMIQAPVRNCTKQIPDNSI